MMKKFLRNRSKGFITIWNSIVILLILILISQPYLFLAPFDPVNTEWKKIAIDRSAKDWEWLQSQENIDLEMNPFLLKVTGMTPEWWVSDYQARVQSGTLYSVYALRLTYLTAELMSLMTDYRDSLENDPIEDQALIGKLVTDYSNEQLRILIEREDLDVEWTPYTSSSYFMLQTVNQAINKMEKDNDESDLQRVPYIDMVGDNAKTSFLLSLPVLIISRVFILPLLYCLSRGKRKPEITKEENEPTQLTES